MQTQRGEVFVDLFVVDLETVGGIRDRCSVFVSFRRALFPFSVHQNIDTFFSMAFDVVYRSLWLQARKNGEQLHCFSRHPRWMISTLFDDPVSFFSTTLDWVSLHIFVLCLCQCPFFQFFDVLIVDRRRDSDLRRKRISQGTEDTGRASFRGQRSDCCDFVES